EVAVEEARATSDVRGGTEADSIPPHECLEYPSGSKERRDTDGEVIVLREPAVRETDRVDMRGHGPRARAQRPTTCRRPGRRPSSFGTGPTRSVRIRPRPRPWRWGRAWRDRRELLKRSREKGVGAGGRCGALPRS